MGQQMNPADLDRINVDVVADRDSDAPAAAHVTGLDDTLIDAAIALAARRFAGQEAIVAALRTGSGHILTGVWTPAAVDSASLCAETGPICEAHRLGERVTASVCLYRPSGDEDFKVLPACGICQERLAVFGLDVEIAVPSADTERLWQRATLRELRPFYWNDEIA
jgi:cytidine deaminase